MLGNGLSVLRRTEKDAGKQNQVKEEQRDKLIAKLLDDAQVQGEKTQRERTEEAPVKEVTPAK